MANPGAANHKDTDKDSDLKHLAEEVFSSEKREDVWAILIAVAVLVLSLAFPEHVYHFFKTGLYVF
jgi:hypothetical protein